MKAIKIYRTFTTKYHTLLKVIAIFVASIWDAVHIGESVFALSYYKNVAVFYPEDNDTITPPVIGIYTSLCCSHSVVHISSGVKYRSFILEWLPHLCNDKRTWLHTFAVILNYEYLEAG